MEVQPDRIIEHIIGAFADDSLHKVSLGQYTGAEPALQKILIRPILLKNSPKLSFTFRYQTRDIAKNFGPEEAKVQLETWLQPQGFQSVSIRTTRSDIQVQRSRKGKWRWQEHFPTTEPTPLLKTHNRPKQYAIKAEERPYLHLLGITDAQGQVLAKAQDKYKQINQFIALLSPQLTTLAPALRVLDMGSGKGYLTFALYDYLHHTLGRQAKVIGVEARLELVEFCNTTATQAGFSDLRFEKGYIADYVTGDFQVLIALHACDTATDDALYQGIRAKAELIVVAPCCHKQIRREMERQKTDSVLTPALQYGIFRERQAEMLTDTLRALLLELNGYSVKIVEFVSDAHTPKNVMLMATRTAQKELANAAAITDQIRELKAFFGIQTHYLEHLLYPNHP
jgi:SAM-dependent methyltransferase